MEHPIKMDDLGTTILGNPHICVYNKKNIENLAECDQHTSPKTLFKLTAVTIVLATHGIAG